MSNDLNKKRKRKRIAALVWSGVLVLIILPFIGTLIAFSIDTFFGFPTLVSFPLNLIIGLPIVAVGFFWAGWSNVALFTIGKGSPVPTKDTQTTELVIKGPYKYSRNPMIFGYILIWIGLGLLIGSIFLTFGFSIIVTLLLILFVKLWEEKDLEERFGKAYSDYIKSTSFIIPKPQRNKNKNR